MVGATDIGLPLSEPGHVALLPTNVAAFGEGLEQSSSDVTLYLALRECARQRLFAPPAGCGSRCWPWSSSTPAASPSTPPRWRRRSGGSIRATSPSSRSTLEGGLFEPQKTPEQLATLERLETMLALVEGWVDEVVTPGDGAVDAGRRRRWPRPYAGPGRPADRPRRPSPPWSAWSCGRGGCGTRPTCGRRCATPAAPTAGTPSGPTRIWCPTSADLDDPLGFVAAEGKSETADDDFDAALAELLDAESGEDQDGPGRE